MPKQSVDYQSWPREEFAISELQLDPFNLRVPDKNLPITEIIEYLIEYENLLSLVEDIATMGYMPIQIVIVYKDGNDNYVLEGNRRLAACFLLGDPSLAPEKDRKKIEELKKGLTREIKTLLVAVAPSRADADLIIAKIHAKSSARQWSTISKTNFFFLKINDGMSIEDISSTYNFTEAEVRKALFANEMYQLAKTLKLPSDVEQIISEPRKFNFTNFSRLFDSATGKKFFGISIGSDGKVKIADADDFEAKMQIAVSDIAQKKVNSRTLNSTADKDKYFATIQAQLPSSVVNTPPVPVKPTPKPSPTPLPPDGSVVPPAPVPTPTPTSGTEPAPLDFPVKNITRKPLSYTSQQAEQIIEFIFNRFPDFVQKLKKRREKRPPLLFEDEYDVQYALYGLLAMHFEDVRDEEWTPSYAGRASRMDFLVQNEEIVIEAKMTRDGLADKEITDQLIIDIAKYEKHPKCKKLFCFVYDPTRKLKNDAALINDLKSKKGRVPKVRVFIAH